MKEGAIVGESIARTNGQETTATDRVEQTESPRKIGRLDFINEPWVTGRNKKVDNIANRLKLEIAHNHVHGFPFTLYLGIDSENLSSNRKRRRYATVVGITSNDKFDLARNKIYQKKRIEVDDTGVAGRIYYEACSVGKALKELNTHEELKRVLETTGSGFELHIDAYTTEKEAYKEKGSSKAYQRIERLIEKREKFPYLKEVRFKPDAIFASGVCDQACRNKI